MKKILAGLVSVFAVLVTLPLVSAFEAHVIDVSAAIENALLVPIRSIDFGTVFPQEKLIENFSVDLSQSFLNDNRYLGVNYFLRQKPQCARRAAADPSLPAFGEVIHGPLGFFRCADPLRYERAPLLCPYLSQREMTTDGLRENDGLPLRAFHGPLTWTLWREPVSRLYTTRGRLVELTGDTSDSWEVDLKVPCFGGHCAQDWAEFVTTVNPNANPANFVQPLANEHLVFGCDLWLEVSGYIGNEA